jgi:hypothetical protein
MRVKTKVNLEQMACEILAHCGFQWTGHPDIPTLGEMQDQFPQLMERVEDFLRDKLKDCLED